MKNWCPVTKRDPCPVCGHKDWCAVSSDGRVARCMRVVDGPDVIAREDSEGTPYGLKFLDGSSSTGPDTRDRYARDPDPERAPDDVLHRVYSALLQCLPLSAAHRLSLRDRGLSDDAIDLSGYRTLPNEAGRRKVMGQLRAALDGAIPEDVPGVFKGKLAGYSGIVIPVRSPGGTVRALKVRADDPHAPKYSWVSSSGDDGPSPGAPCHAPIVHVPAGSTRVVRVTEGPLKADVATALSGVLTLGVAGCSMVRHAVPHLRALKAEVVTLAWDADARDNRHVAASLARAVKELRAEGFAVQVETWDSSAGKGIDDALRAGAPTTVHGGEAVDRVVREIVAAAEKVRALKEAAEKKVEKSNDSSDSNETAASARSSSSSSKWFDRGDSVELAHALLADLRAQAPDAGPNGQDAVVYDRGSVWVYDPARGVYGERDRSDLVRSLATFAGSPCGPKGKPLSLSDGAIKGAIFTAQNLAARPGYFDAAPHGVACANGFVRVDGGSASVSPHSPAHRATHALDVAYDPGAVCPMWDDALREILRRQVVDESGEVAGLDEDDTLGSVDLIHEFAGASLFGAATVYAVSLVLHGPGNDGKSTILNVLRSLFPPSSVCSIAPQDWTRGFLLAGLAGKLLNVVNELPEREMMEGARFKAVTSGDPLTAERKFGDPFTMRVVAGELFAANDLFPTRDQSAGFWRRFIVVPCTRSFSQSEVVHDLWRKIAAEETAGILARVVEGYARLQGNGRYTTPESSTRAKAEWQVSSDQVRQFVEECCNEVPPGAPSSERATAAELYPVYRAWCGTVGHTPVSQITLAKRLKGLGYFKRVGSAKTYMVRASAAWQTRAGLTPTVGGGYRAPLN